MQEQSVREGRGYLGAYRVFQANVRAGDRVGIIGSTDVPTEFYEAFMAAAPAFAAEATVGLMLPPDAPGHPAPPELEAFAEACDLVIMAASVSIAHSSTSQRVLMAGKRLITFPVPSGEDALDALSDLEQYSQERLQELRSHSEAVGRVLDHGSTVAVRSDAGTTLSLKIGGRMPHIWYGVCAEGPYTHNMSSLPPSEAHIACIETATQGVFSADGYISGIGTPSSPIQLYVEDGRVTSVVGGPEARQLEELLAANGPSAFVVSEFGVGTNPYQRVAGANGGKKKAGTVHIALGNNKSAPFGGLSPDGANACPIHLDLIALAPVRAEVDGRVLVEEGRLNPEG